MKVCKRWRIKCSTTIEEMVGWGFSADSSTFQILLDMESDDKIVGQFMRGSSRGRKIYHIIYAWDSFLDWHQIRRKFCSNSTDIFPSDKKKNYYHIIYRDGYILDGGRIGCLHILYLFLTWLFDFSSLCIIFLPLLFLKPENCQVEGVNGACVLLYQYLFSCQ
jgi:hypothetical protein